MQHEDSKWIMDESGMTFRSWERRKKLDVRLLQPQLPVCGGEISAIVTQLVTCHFPDIATPPGVFFGRTQTLAHIEDALREERSGIWLHHALNDHATPDYVFAFVITHELLHVRIRPREVDGKWSAHPPEFWEEENRIAVADRSRAWEWIYRQFGYALREDKEQECIWVNNRRMDELLRNRACSEHELNQLRESFGIRQGELRFGFREHALRAIEDEKDH